MNAYVYQAALYCEPCGEAIRLKLDPSATSLDEISTFDDYDSDDFPCGPYADGGGEADCPQHCDSCSVFLENPLTGDGYEYVRDAVTDPDASGDVLITWREFYGIEVEL